MTDVETAKMSERGQIIIPKDVREYIDAKENTIFTIMPIDKETIIMRKLDKAQLVKEFRSIRAGVKEKMSQKDIAEEVKQSRK
jgi:AbrB family looped-hinge helix DNA binding protein